MKLRILLSIAFVLGLALASVPMLAQQKEPAKQLDYTPKPIAGDKSIKYDYDIVYVRQPRYGEDRRPGWAEFSDPTRMEPGSDLMLLHPDGSEEVLVSGKDGSVMDPYVSFDGESVYYSKFIDEKNTGADI